MAMKTLLNPAGPIACLLACLLVCLSAPQDACAQTTPPLRPGFDKWEYLECLAMSSSADSLRIADSYKCPKPKAFGRMYMNAEVGFDNHWELWQDGRGLTAIVLRATVTTQVSWMGNFNAGMVAAQGSVRMGRDIAYDLCADTAAHIHAGWTAGLMTMADDIFHKVDSCYAAGCRDFFITGHSQGGALSMLCTALMRRAQATGRLPQDIRLKTYSSAAPKPGDYLFALHYENMTRGGWAFNVVSADDWVPETPLSVQRPMDMRPTNPFAQMDVYLKALSASDKMKMKFLYNRIAKPTDKSVKSLTKYLGNEVGKILEKERPAFSRPVYSDCANFARTGQTIVLMPTPAYYAKHPKVSADAFEHHMFGAYYELAQEVL